MANHLTSSLTHLLLTRQSDAELAIEDKNEASFFNMYKWLILGGLFAFIIQVLACWWFLKRRRNRKARLADEENQRVAKTFSNVGVARSGGNVNVWGKPTVDLNSNHGAGAGNNVWYAVPVGGPAEVPPAYDGRREEFGPGGKI